jgi:adenylate kinase family enzyme
MSRPEKIIDWNRVDDLLKAGCLGTEIAATFDVHPQTFYSRVEEKYNCSFTHYSQERRALGESLIREKQFQKALGLTDTGDNTMLIWLGKNRLGQRNEDKLSIVTQEQQTTLDKTMDMVDFLQNKQDDIDPKENVE